MIQVKNILNEEFCAKEDTSEFHYGTGKEYFSIWLGETIITSLVMSLENKVGLLG